MELSPGVVRLGEAAAAERYSFHSKISSVLLHQEFCCHLRHSKQAMHRVVDRHSFGNAPLCIGVVNIDFPPSFMLDQRAYSHRVSLRAKIVAKMTTRKPDLEAAHRHCYKCRKEVMASEICGCFHCLATFPPGEIEEWLDDGQTAVCPKCGIDSVIGSASGFSIDEHFLGSMNQRWFSCGGPRANRVH